jgi:hypothetical protein
MTIQEQTAKLREDEKQGFREYGPCADCGGMRYQFYMRGSASWIERPTHAVGENCVIILRRRIEALEARLAAVIKPAKDKEKR